MFKGVNKLYLNEATLMAALEMYLNDPILDANKHIKVTGVSERPTDKMFEVRTENK